MDSFREAEIEVGEMEKEDLGRWICRGRCVLTVNYPHTLRFFSFFSLYFIFSVIVQRIRVYLS